MTAAGSASPHRQPPTVAARPPSQPVGGAPHTGRANVDEGSPVAPALRRNGRPGPPQTLGNGSLDVQRQQDTTLAARRPSAITAIVRPSATGMRFNSRMPYELWSALGPRIAARANASRWWLGDWLVFGERHYGSRYRVAIETTGLDYQTLRNYAMVARRFEPSRRRDNLSFQHHAELCSLPDQDQDRWLDLAAQHQWSRRELRSRLQRCRERDASHGDHHLLRLTVDPVRELLWREAAASCGCSLEEWVVRALDVAAANLI
jgi:hypothetical protein